ncbi:MAG: 16S rRNA (cytosine(967)-C(5))-methyltransferase RsmB [Desulfotalea sp.]
MSKKTTPASSRFIATTALCTLYAKKTPIKQILEKLYIKEKPSAPERALTMNIVFGVLRNRQSIDILIRKMSTVRLKKIQPFVHQSIAVALYQIFFLDSIPESAAVNEAVKSCQKEKIPKRLHGFVNGILRNSLRHKEVLEEILKDNKNIITNHPDWLLSTWKEQFGDDICQEIVEINNKEPQLAIRVNQKQISLEQYELLLAENNIEVNRCIAPDCLIINNFQGNPQNLPSYEQGFFQVQDQAAQLSCLLLGKIDDGNFLDACAGLGGKTSYIADLAQGNQVNIIALEPEGKRRDKFSENMQRLQIDSNIEVIACTAQEYSQNNKKEFKGIIVDAPCSGTGVIRRHPDIRWNRSPQDIIKNQTLQLEILIKSSELLAQNGVLVYATCSLQVQENYEVIKKLLAQNSDFYLDKITDLLPKEASKHIVKNELGEFFAPRPCLEMDGFFAARLRKR